MTDTKDDLLHPSGLYNPALRFAFTNVTKEDFTSYWSGQPIKIKAGQSVELTHHLAVKLTKELVDKIMQEEAKLDEEVYYKNNPNTAPNLYRSSKGLSLGIPAARKPYEDSVCRLLAHDEESPETQVLRAELRAEIMANMNQEPSHSPAPIPSVGAMAAEPNAKVPGEVFAELRSGNEQKPEKPALKLKKL